MTEDLKKVRADLGYALRETMMLAGLTVRVWSGTVNDTEIVEGVRQQAGVAMSAADIGQFRKRLMANSGGRFDAISKQAGVLRNMHYSRTMPYVRDGAGAGMRGPRLLPTSRFMSYVKEFGAAKAEFDRLVKVAIDNYPTDMAAAIAALGSLARPEQYPTQQELVNAHRAFIDFMPLPSGGDFSGLPDNTLERLADQFDKRTQAAVGNAMACSWDRLRKRVERLASIFGGDEATVFRANTIEGLGEFLDDMGAFNIAGDHRFSEVLADLRPLVGYTAKQVRGDSQIGDMIGDLAKRTLSKMDGWGV